MKAVLKGQVAIVTGASQGIGRAISVTLAGAGARVVLAARNMEKLAETERMIAAKGGDALTLEMDVTDPASIHQMAEKTLDTWKQVDILINNSGIAGPTADCEKVPLDEWEYCMAVNVRGPFLCAQAVLPSMKARRSGRIINLSSITGKRPLTQRTTYAMSKMAVVGFTRTLAIEVGRFNITINAISPGAVEGDRINLVIAAAAKAEGKPIEEIQARFTQSSALGRMVTEQDIADMALFLCSPSGANITAQDFSVCAGTTWY